MKVSLILQKKGSSEVATIAPDAALRDAVAILSDKRIGALVVSPGGGQIAGILSERDVVTRLGQDGPDALDTPVHTVMTADVETCTADETALVLLDRMTKGRFRPLPVVGKGDLMIGILSIGDVVKARLEEIEAENAAMADMLSG